jgi:tripeptide aminopeptidase
VAKLFRLSRSKQKPAEFYPGIISELLQTDWLPASFRAASAERSWINEHHLKICRTPAPTFFESRRAELVQQIFQQLGWTALIDPAGNVIAHRLKDQPAQSFVAITAHLDTVLAPRGPEEVGISPDGRYFGPGVADNGAGLAGLVAIAKLIQNWPENRPVAPLLIANVGEEGEGNLSGMRYLCEQSELVGKIAAFLVLDGPSLDHITTQALGSKRFEINVMGVGGHSWSDAGTGNPVHALSRTISYFVDHPLLKTRPKGRMAFNFGVIEGGGNVTSIPTLARTKVDLRSDEPDTLTDLATLLRSCVERAIEVENDTSPRERVTAKIREIGSRPGGKLDPDSTLWKAIRAVDDQLSMRAKTDVASTDANVPLSLGIPAISIGAGGSGGGAHTVAEWYSPEGRELGIRRILLLLAVLMHSPTS